MTSFATKTHPGLRRSRNEDHSASSIALGLWVVADGVGGHTHGDVASRIACEAIVSKIEEGTNLVESLRYAHLAVLEEIRRRGSSDNMGTTAVVLKLSGKEYEIAWVGDSRAYLFDADADELVMLTTDHSAVFDLVGRGEISLEQARTHPQRHALSRSLGVSEQNASEPSVVSGTLNAGQQLLLCSDGLTDELSDTSIAYLMNSNPDLDLLVEALVDKALLSGGRDNITVTVVGDAIQASAQPAVDQKPDLICDGRDTQGILTSSGSRLTLLCALVVVLCTLGLMVFLTA